MTPGEQKAIDFITESYEDTIFRLTVKRMIEFDFSKSNQYMRNCVRALLRRPLVFWKIIDQEFLDKKCDQMDSIIDNAEKVARFAAAEAYLNAIRDGLNDIECTEEYY